MKRLDEGLAVLRAQLEVLGDSTDNIVLVSKAARLGLDLDMYFSHVSDFSYFPENLEENYENMDPVGIGIASVKILKQNKDIGHFRVPVQLRVADGRILRATAMIDSGADGIFLDRKFVAEHKIGRVGIARPIKVLSIDGSPNLAGAITEVANVQMIAAGGEHTEYLRCLITDLGNDQMILGLPWLQKHNPDIDWDSGEVLLGSGQQSAESGANPWDENTRFRRVSATRLQRRQWWKEGKLESTSDEVWLAAGFTYSTLIAEEANREKRARTFEEIVPPQYRDFPKVYSEEEASRLPEHAPHDHAIDLKPGAPDFHRSKNYPLAPEEARAVEDFISENEAKGYITKSNSPYAAPVFFVKKKDGKLRLIQDYRWLNEWTVKNVYPLPLSTDIVNRLAGAKYFTKFDVRWGYHNVRIKEGDEWKAAFTTHKGLYEPRVMLFGLTNSPATFQTLMNSIFGDLVAEGVVAVYMDDILIFTKTLEEHRLVVREVLRRLEANDLYLRPDKCEFEKTEVEYLGMYIRENHVSMDPAKVRAVVDWPTPRNLKDLRGFLGFANFYRRFIEGFAKLARPLNDLTKKDVAWRWTDVEAVAFEGLKYRFTSAPVLAMWHPDCETQLSTDASGYATSGVLEQKQQEDDLYHPVAFRSQSMTATERNYEIYDRELLAIIQALEDWRHYLIGLPKPFTIYSDHANLTHWRTARHLTRRQARWYMTLSQYNFNLVHKPGKKNIVPDAMTRDSTREVTDAEDNRDIVMLGPEHFRKVAAVHFASSEEVALEERLRKVSQQDAEVLQGLASLKKNGLRKMLDGTFEWEEEDGLVYHRGKLYVPNDVDLRRAIVRSCHDAPTAGHPGQARTLELVSRHYWWPRVRDFVTKYVEGCDTCQRNKAPMHPKTGLTPVDVPEGPWQVVGQDLITGLPTVRGFNAIATFVDHYGKQVHVVPTTETVDAEGIADLHHREIFRLHGIPRKFISDRGPQFASRVMRALLKKLGVEAGITTAYHPQANGQTERMNREVATYLRLFCNKRKSDWVDLLPTAEFALNNRVHEATGFSPFFLMYGYHPDFTVTPGRTAAPAVDQRLSCLHEARQEAEASLRMAKERMRATHQARTTQKPFEIGSEVWLDARDLRIKGPAKKLNPKRLGPFKVLARIGDHDYRLELPPGMDLHDVFHVDRLTPAVINDVYGAPSNPPPVEVDGQEEYEVEAILDSKLDKRYKGGILYLVRWKGYGPKGDTWEGIRNLGNAKEAVAEFHRRHPEAPRRVAAADFASFPWQTYENLTVSDTPYAWEDGRYGR